MDRYFETLGTNTYLTVRLSAGDELDTMSLGMLTNNTIPGFAPASFMQMDDEKYIKYNITSKVAVSQLFSGPVNRKRLLGVFSGIVDAMLSSEDYMLDPQTVLLDLDYIFTDVTSCETNLICLPVLQESAGNVELGTFFKKIMFTTQFDQTEKCDHVAQILNYLNSAASLSLTEFKEILDNLVGAPKPVPVVKPAPVVQQPVAPVKPVQPAAASVVKNIVQPVVNAVVAQTHSAASSNAAGGIIEIPGGGAVPNVDEARSSEKVEKKPETEEKGMSWFYLMQHYNKENAAIYKAQQENKKTQKGTSQAKKSKPQKSGKPEKRQPQKTAEFAMPGDPVPDFTFQINTPAPAQPEVNQLQNKGMEPQQPQQPQQIQQPVSINFGQTTILGAMDGGTTVLVAPPQNKKVAMLIRVRTEEKVVVNKPTFKIGKERSYVDYAITGNSAVSRSHAMIINRDEEYLVEDTNSTNHTYVDGKMIPAGVATRIRSGSRIRFADEEFEFVIQ